jgi:tetratricopeptide (TPR) repeat protein
VRPTAAPPDAQRATRQLSAIFAQEPELISACLQDIEHKPPEWAQTVLDAAQIAVAGQPGYADLNYHAGRAALAASDLDTAARLLEQALRANPAYRDALVLAARVELRRGRPQVARAHLAHALACGADYPDVHLLMGNICRQIGEWGAARHSYERALALNGRLTEARAALAKLPPMCRSGESHELPA